jgi:hypothetical protein
MVVPVSAAETDLDVSITVTAGGAPLSGAMVVLAADGSAVLASESAEGVYTAAVPEGTYRLSIDPPSGSPYEPYEDPAFDVSGPTVTTIALFLPVVDPDPDPDDPDLGTVRGSVRNGLGDARAGLRVALTKNGVTVAAVTDTNGDYALDVPPGEWVVEVRTLSTTRAAAGWPTFFNVTYRDPVTVTGGAEVTRDVVISFVEQPVRVLLPDGEPAGGFDVIVRISPTLSQIPSDSEFASLFSQDTVPTNPDGEARPVAFPTSLGRDGFIRANGAGQYLNVQVTSDVVTGSLPTTEPVLLQFAEARTLKGVIRDQFGPLRGNVWVSSQDGTRVPSIDTGTSGTFEVLFPSAPGPYVLNAQAFGTSPRAWSFVTAPLDDELSDLGDVVVPRTDVRLCVVDEVTDAPVDASVRLSFSRTVLSAVSIGADDLTADFTFDLAQVATSSSTRCSTRRLPAGAEVGMTLLPDTYSAYYTTPTAVDTRLGAEEVSLRLGRFDQLPDSVAVDVDLRLVNGLGIGLGELPALLGAQAYTRLDVTRLDGGLTTRLVRNEYELRNSPGRPQPYPTAAGFTSAIGGSSPDGRYSIRLALEKIPAAISSYDLGSMVLPFVPVDVSVRGTSSEPLVGTILETPRVESCAGVDGVVIQVCASSAYSASMGLRIPGVTNVFGRERLWLVPGVHQLTVTPAATAALTAAATGTNYQAQTLTVTVAEDSQGQSVFVVLQDPSGTVDPDPSPQVNVGGPYVVAEGNTVELAATVLAGSPNQWAWDLDDDGTFETTGQSVTFDATGLVAPSTAGVRVRACDAQDRCAEDATSITIIEADPVEPDPVEPDPEEPDLVEPDPVEPDPVEPDPEEPDLVEPDPVEPDPEEPGPVEPVVTEPVVVDESRPSEPLLLEPTTDELQLPVTGPSIHMQIWLALLASFIGLALVRTSRMVFTRRGVW